MNGQTSARESGLSVEAGVNGAVYVESWGSVVVIRQYVTAGYPCKLFRPVFAELGLRSGQVSVLSRVWDDVNVRRCVEGDNPRTAQSGMVVEQVEVPSVRCLGN